MLLGSEKSMNLLEQLSPGSSVFIDEQYLRSHFCRFYGGTQTSRAGSNYG
jgi:hypothetical protein